MKCAVSASLIDRASCERLSGGLLCEVRRERANFFGQHSRQLGPRIAMRADAGPVIRSSRAEVHRPRHPKNAEMGSVYDVRRPSFCL